MQQILCPQLVGRHEELSAVSGALASAQESRGGAVFLVGEAGVGKSRIAREAVALARSAGMAVLTGRATQRSVAYAAVAEALLAAARNAGPPQDPALRPFLTALGRLVPDWRDSDTPAADEPPFVLGEALVRVLRSVATPRGALLVLEDLHWADTDTLAIVEYLVDTVAGEPVACLFTLRPDAGEALTLARSGAGRRAAHVFDLARLDDPEIAAMATACLDDTDVPPALLSALCAWADGVPLLVEDLLATLASAGTLVRERSAWRVSGEIRPVVPATFATAVRERLGAAGEPARSIVHAAAVLGRRFDWALLAPACGLPETAVLDALRTAVDAQLLAIDASGGGFAFRHALTRDAILGELLPQERRAVSRRAGDALVTAASPLSDEDCELASELAAAAGDDAAAAAYLLEAGRRAHARGSLAAAESLLERAETYASSDTATLAHVLETLVEVLSLAGKPDESVAAASRLLPLLDSTGAGPDRVAAVHTCVSRACVAAGRLGEASDRLHKARGLARQADVMARVHALDAHIAIADGRPADAERLANEAVDLADREGLAEVACEALEVVGRCARLRSPQAARDAFARALAVAERAGLTVWRVRAMYELGTLELLESNGDEALRRARDMALASGALATANVIELELGIALAVQFRLDEAIDILRGCGEQALRFRFTDVAAFALGSVGFVEAIRGRRAEAEQATAQAQEVSSSPVIAGLCRFTLATNQLLAENRDAARALLGEGVDLFESSPTSAPHHFRALWALLQAVGDGHGEAAIARIRASNAATNTCSLGLLAYADAVVHGRASRLAKAAEAMAAGDHHLGNAPWDRRIGLRFVAEAAIADGWGDPVPWLRDALAFFDGCGQDRIAAACRGLLRKAGAPVPRKGRGSSAVPAQLRALGVTNREMDVLSLVGEGLSNKQIGERLYVSPRTVETHVENLLAKTRLRSRAELVAFAARA